MLRVASAQARRLRSSATTDPCRPTARANGTREQSGAGVEVGRPVPGLGLNPSRTHAVSSVAAPGWTCQNTPGLISKR